MTCRELADFISDYLTGDLPGNVRAAFDHHLTRCPNCVSYLQSYRTTVELGRRAFDPNAPDADLAIPDELVAAILAARSS